MEKEYFIKEKTRIQKEINDLKDQLEDLESNYIKSNQEFPIGSKVCVTTFIERYDHKTNEMVLIPEEKHYSFVVDYTIVANDEIQPVLMKARKDGALSKHRDLLLFQRFTIELAE